MKRKIWLWIAGICFGIGAIFALGGNTTRASATQWTNPNGFRYSNHDGSSFVTSDATTEIWGLIKTDAVVQKEGLLQRLMGVFKLDTPEYEGKLKAFYYIKKLINYALAFVSFIAFLILLYTFYMMLIWDGAKGRDKAKATLKGLAIAIVIMGLSWMIVSMIFWIYEQQAV